MEKRGRREEEEREERGRREEGERKEKERGERKKRGEGHENMAWIRMGRKDGEEMRTTTTLHLDPGYLPTVQCSCGAPAPALFALSPPVSPHSQPHPVSE